MNRILAIATSAIFLSLSCAGQKSLLPGQGKKSSKTSGPGLAASSSDANAISRPHIKFPDETIILGSNPVVEFQIESQFSWKLALSNSRDGLDDLEIVCDNQPPTAKTCSYDFSKKSPGALFAKLVFDENGATHVVTGPGAVEILAPEESSRKPFVAITAPASGKVLSEAQPIKINWNVTDLEDLPTKTKVEASLDGATWTTIGENLESTTGEVSWTPSSKGIWTLRATASNGGAEGARLLKQVFVGATSFDETAGAIFKAKCATCHSSTAKAPPKNLVLDSCLGVPKLDAQGQPVLNAKGEPTYQFGGAKSQARRIVERAVTLERLPAMPPAGNPQLTDSEKDTLLWWASSSGQCQPGPGR